MRDDYKLKGKVMKVELEIEADVAEKLAAMEKFTKHTRAELANTALKRFISSHSDFLPKEPKKN